MRKCLKNSVRKGRRGKRHSGKRTKSGQIWANFGVRYVPIMLQTKQDEGNGNFQSTRARSPKKARRNLLREHPRHA